MARLQAKFRAPSLATAGDMGAPRARPDFALFAEVQASLSPAVGGKQRALSVVRAPRRPFEAQKPGACGRFDTRAEAEDGGPTGALQWDTERLRLSRDLRRTDRVRTRTERRNPLVRVQLVERAICLLRPSWTAVWRHC
jgi:hypothetical protein